MPWYEESPLAVGAGTAAGFLQGRHQRESERYARQRQQYEDTINAILAQGQLQDYQSQARLRDVQTQKDWQDAAQAAIIAPGQLNLYTGGTEGRYGSYGFQKFKAETGRTQVQTAEQAASASRQKQEAQKYANQNKYVALNQSLNELNTRAKINKEVYDAAKAKIDAGMEPDKIASEIARNYRTGTTQQGIKLNQASALYVLGSNPNWRPLAMFLGDPKISPTTKLQGISGWGPALSPLGVDAAYTLLASGWTSKREQKGYDPQFYSTIHARLTRYPMVPAAQIVEIDNWIKSGQVQNEQDIEKLLMQAPNDPAAQAALQMLRL